MIAMIDGQVFSGSRLRALLDITGSTHFKSIKIGNKWEKTPVRWGIGVPETANKQRGEVVGNQEVSLELVTPQAFWGQMERNFVLMHQEDIIKSSIPMVMTIIMEGDSSNPVVRLSTAQTWVVEFTVSETSDFGGEAGSTEENFITVSCNVVNDPVRMNGPIQVGGF